MPNYMILKKKVKNLEELRSQQNSFVFPEKKRLFGFCTYRIEEKWKKCYYKKWEPWMYVFPKLLQTSLAFTMKKKPLKPLKKWLGEEYSYN